MGIGVVVVQMKTFHQITVSSFSMHNHKKNIMANSVHLHFPKASTQMSAQ